MLGSRLLGFSRNRCARYSGQRQRQGIHVCPVFEQLENRLLLSVYYNFDIIASSGQQDLAGNTLASLDPEISVNNSGNVAFVANLSGGATGRGLMVGNGTAAARNIAFTPSLARQYSFPQINDGNQVAARDAISGNSLVRTWNANASASFNVVADSFDDYEAVLLPTVANDGGFGFLALDQNLDTKLLFNATATEGADTEIMQLSGGGFRPMAADGSNLVIRNGSFAAGDVILAEGASQTLLGSTGLGWNTTGRAPGISEKGEVVVWAGDRGSGPGVFASVREPGGTRRTIVIAGEADTNGDGSFTPADNPLPELGYTQAGANVQNLFFSAINLDNRISVTMYHNAATNNNVVDPGEKFIVTFMGTPSQASRNNPVTGNPMLFSASEGIWAVHVNADAPLSGAGMTDYNKTSAIPVILVGDTVGGRVITALAMHDPIATAAFDTAGNARMVNPGDHYLAFFAQHAGGSMVVRGTHLDVDGDGLFDHWEQNGIDIDLDGAIDLDLPALGAQVMRKDIFIEVDWLRPDTLTGRSFAPQPAAINFLVNMFATAPVNNPDGTMGITAHIDAGATRSVNMAPAGQMPAAGSLQGGDQIGQAGTGNHIHVLYFGVDGSVTSPGMMDANGRPIVTRSVENIKQSFFGSTTKFARDLAFHYSIFGDRQSNPGNGSSGLGEISWYPGSNHTIPGNDFLVTLQGSADSATLSVPPGGPPGTPATIPTPVGFFQGQTFAHELGHTLALQHGGVDSVTSRPPGWASHVPANYKPNYRSLMSYSYQFVPDNTGTLVSSYSGPGDAVYDNWSNMKLNFPLYLDNVNNTFGITTRQGDPPPFSDLPETTVEEIEEVHGPLESQAPAVAIDAPAANAMVTIGENLTVTVTATDNVAVAVVTIEFDLNGNGVIDPVTERLAAGPIGNDQYRVTFNNVAGPAGARDVTAAASDAAELETPVTIALNVTGGFILGDMNGDGALDAFDVAPFELALADRQAFNAQFPDVDPDLAGDIDQSSQFDAFDVAPFEILLAGGAAAPATQVTEPASSVDLISLIEEPLGGERSPRLLVMRRLLSLTEACDRRSELRWQPLFSSLSWSHIESIHDIRRPRVQWAVGLPVRDLFRVNSRASPREL